MLVAKRDKIKSRMLDYKNFYAHVEFDAELRLFSITIINSATDLLFYARDLSEAKAKMSLLLDRYIILCRLEGIKALLCKKLPDMSLISNDIHN